MAPSVEGGRVVPYVLGLQYAVCLSVGVSIYDKSLAQVHLVIAGGVPENVCLLSCIYLSLPVSVNYSLTKASVGCRNV